MFVSSVMRLYNTIWILIYILVYDYTIKNIWSHLWDWIKFKEYNKFNQTLNLKMYKSRPGEKHI